MESRATSLLEGVFGSANAECKASIKAEFYRQGELSLEGF